MGTKTIIILFIIIRRTKSSLYTIYPSKHKIDNSPNCIIIYYFYLMNHTWPPKNNIFFMLYFFSPLTHIISKYMSKLLDKILTLYPYTFGWHVHMSKIIKKYWIHIIYMIYNIYSVLDTKRGNMAFKASKFIDI